MGPELGRRAARDARLRTDQRQPDRPARGQGLTSQEGGQVSGDRGTGEQGSAVTVELPNGKPVKGEVASVGKRATAPEGGGGEGGSGQGAETLPVTITIKDQKPVGQLESGPVTVEYVGREVKDVLAVPVSTLVALAEGGHGLEAEEGRSVAVKTGLFADGKVEVGGAAPFGVPGIRPGTGRFWGVCG